MLGLAFKPETDDMREAPAIGIIRSLLEEGAKCALTIRWQSTEAMKLLPEIAYADDEYAAVKGADALVFVTEWNQFRALDMIAHSRFDDEAPRSPTCEIFTTRKTCENSVLNMLVLAGKGNKSECH